MLDVGVARTTASDVRGWRRAEGPWVMCRSVRGSPWQREALRPGSGSSVGPVLVRQGVVVGGDQRRLSPQRRVSPQLEKTACVADGRAACVAREDEEGRRVRAEAMHAAWFASSVKAVVAAVATMTMGAAASTPATVSVRQPRRRRRGAPNSRRGANVLYVRMGGDVVG